MKQLTAVKSAAHRKVTKVARKTTKSLRLPTAATFVAMPLPKRTALFTQWLKTQPRDKTYDYYDIEGCPLGTFATALHRAPSLGAASSILGHPNPSPPEDQLPDIMIYRYGGLGDPRWAALRNSTTFGQVADAFAAALEEEHS